MDALKGKDVRAEERARIRAQSPRFSPVTEFVKNPYLFDVYDPAYDWLTDAQRRHLDQDFEFSYYDIMQCASAFLTITQACAMLMVEERLLDEYVQVLFRKPIRTIYEALLAANKHAAVTDIFAKWAGEGSSTAMSILAHGVMKLDEENQTKQLQIKIVNDLDSPDEEVPPKDGDE